MYKRFFTTPLPWGLEWYFLPLHPLGGRSGPLDHSTPWGLEWYFLPLHPLGAGVVPWTTPQVNSLLQEGSSTPSFQLSILQGKSIMLSHKLSILQRESIMLSLKLSILQGQSISCPLELSTSKLGSIIIIDFRGQNPGSEIDNNYRKTHKIIGYSI